MVSLGKWKGEIWYQTSWQGSKYPRLMNREVKKLRRLLQRKRHIKIELCVKLSVLRWFQFGHDVQKRRRALSFAWHEWVSCKGKEWKSYSRGLALSSKPQKWKSHVVVWQTTSKNCTKKRAARAARLFFFIQPIKPLVVAVFQKKKIIKCNFEWIV